VCVRERETQRGKERRERREREREREREGEGKGAYERLRMMREVEGRRGERREGTNGLSEGKK
jgi:hypothetical protein